MNDMGEKVKKSKEVVLEALEKWKPEEICVAWTGGKDSTVLLHLIREAFSGKVPFPIFFNDSTIEFPEIYDFIKKIQQQWQLNLFWVKHLPEDLNAYEKSKRDEEKMEIMRIAKINALNYALATHNLKAFISGIRWDEHGARSDEKYFSPRSTHMRIHPILHFTLEDIWEYTRLYNVPYVDLYDKGYKSLGEAPFTNPVDDANAPERAGRESAKEETMERLRKLGYW